MNTQIEPTRIREHGTHVTNTTLDGQASKITALRDILVHGMAKIDGVTVDSFSASAIVQVYDAINEANKVKFLALPVHKMAQIAFKFCK